MGRRKMAVFVQFFAQKVTVCGGPAEGEHARPCYVMLKTLMNLTVFMTNFIVTLTLLIIVTAT